MCSVIRRPVSKAVLASTAIGKGDKLPGDGSCRAIPLSSDGNMVVVVAFYRVHAYPRFWTFQNQFGAALASARSAASEGPSPALSPPPLHRGLLPSQGESSPWTYRLSTSLPTRTSSSSPSTKATSMKIERHKRRESPPHPRRGVSPP